MKHNYWKRTLAGVMALALTVGAVPLNTGMNLFGGAAIVANAENEDDLQLTVYDGTETSNHVPIYGLWLDAVTRCQYVIPAADLADLDGCDIKELWYYASETNYTFAASMNVYLKKVDYTGISAYESTEDCTPVYQGTLSIGADNVVRVVFDSPFRYNGGNLLIGMENPVKGSSSYRNILFYGTPVAGSSICSYAGDLASVSATQQNFIPKTTFIYEEPAHAPYDVVLNSVENAAVTGETTQNSVTKRISQVTYTADEGYYFAEFADIVQNGITVKRADNYTITVSGTPTANTTIETIPNAVAIPGVTLSGGANAVQSGSIREGITYTANDGYYFAEFEDIVQNGITVKRVDNYTVTVSGFPTAETMINVPNAAAIPSVTLNGGANAVQSGSIKEGITYTANDGCYFAEFEDIVQNGITIKRVDNYTVTVSGFPTAATAITIPDAVVTNFIEDRYDFEDGQIPAGWTQQSSNNGYQWENGTGDYYSNTGAHSGSKNLRINHKDTLNVNCYLIMPAMDLSAVQSADIDLWYINRSWSGDIDEFGVYYRIGETGEWNEVFHTAQSHTIWTNLNVSLPAAALTGNVQIGFKALDHYGYGVGLDDVVITKVFASQTTSLADATLTFDKASFNYTGEAITPELTVKYGEETLTEGVDYEITADSTTSATEKGDYTVTIEGKGDYTGTATAIWQIVAPKQYAVSVSNGTIQNNNGTSGTFAEATAVTVIGDTKKGCWKDASGNIVSYKCKYKLYAMYDTVLTWNADAPQEADAVANINLSERTYNATTKKTTVKVTSEWSLPAGATIIEAGTLRTASTEEITAEQLKSATYFKKSTLTTTRGTFYFNINLSEATKNKTIYAMTYVKYSYNGTEYTLYSDMLTSAPTT